MKQEAITHVKDVNPIVNPDTNGFEVNNFLSYFCYEINSGIKHLMHSYRKSGNEIPKAQYFVSPVDYTTNCQWKRIKEIWHSGLVRDGDYGIALLARERLHLDPIFMASCGFSFTPKAKEDNCRIRDMMIPDSSLVISQIQGPDWQYRKRNEANKLLTAFRWELFLVNNVVEIGTAIGVENIYLIPAELNPYFGLMLQSGDGDNKELMLRRYNGSAKKCGFKKDLKTGLYKLEAPLIKRSLA